jgi:hypothetical protein
MRESKSQQKMCVLLLYGLFQSVNEGVSGGYGSC